MSDILLTIELVPETCWNSNLRSVLPKKEWDVIRKEAYKNADNQCEICGNAGRLECHEIWEYDDEKHIQKLVGLIALCSPCHLVKHMGFARIKGKEEAAIQQLMLVNDWTREEANKYIEEAFRVYAERSKQEWKQDMSLILKEENTA